MTFIRPSSKIFRILQKVIFAYLTFIIPSTQNRSGNGFQTPSWKIWDFFRDLRCKIIVFGEILRFMQKVIFAEFTFITQSSPKKEVGLTFMTSSTRKLWL